MELQQTPPDAGAEVNSACRSKILSADLWVICPNREGTSRRKTAIIILALIDL